MLKDIDLRELKSLYQQNVNIIKTLKDRYGTSEEISTEIIKVSYDLQSGSYTRFVNENPELVQKYTSLIAETLSEIEFDSIIEIGCGEATTLANVLRNLKNPIKSYFGFDISFSRLIYARDYLKKLDFNQSNNIFMGDLFNIPLVDSSIDVVYTSHSLEPNGGREEEALKELYRVARKYVVLLEPCFELASEVARNRMQEHGYVTNLAQKAKDLGYEVIAHNLFGVCSNPLNPTGLTIIRKMPVENASRSLFRCPVSHKDLNFQNNAFYSESAGLVYPILRGIPCLLEQNAIIALHFDLL